MELIEENTGSVPSLHSSGQQLWDRKNVNMMQTVNPKIYTLVFKTRQQKQAGMGNVIAQCNVCSLPVGVSN